MKLKELQVGRFFRVLEDTEGKVWRKSYPLPGTPEDQDEVALVDAHQRTAMYSLLPRETEIIALRQVISYEVA